MRKKRHEEHENHERWLVSYADFITLLFAFFVVLYAIGNQNLEKSRQFEDSIKREFKMTLVGLGAGAGQSGTGGTVKSPGGLAVPIISDPFDVMRRMQISNEELEDAVRELINKNISPKNQEKSISEIRHDQFGVRIILAASEFFPSGKREIKRQALETLDRVAVVLKAANRRIVIEGHTDSLPLSNPKGEISSNWELASLRATSVLRYLVKYHEINPQKIVATSFADQNPVAPNDTEENRNKNRRIEIVILNDQKNL
jgi:chemotaxis protein MotB